MELTQKTVETAIYEGRSFMSKSGRKRWSQHVLWDDSLPGFGLRITPTNRKSFIVSYRAGGRKRTKTVGAAGRLKLDEARRRATELLASLSDEAPGETTGASQTEPIVTVAQLADAYLEQHLKGSVPSWYADQRLMQTHIKPAMGRSPIAEVTRTDLANIRSRVAKRFPNDARRLATLLAGMFDWATERGLWSKSARGKTAARAADREAPPERAGREAEPTPPPSAAQLQERLDRSEAERRDLAVRLDEISASGVEMVARLGEQAKTLERTERELALARRELERAQAAGADRPLHERTEKQMANLRQSVDQLMTSLREARSERSEMADQLAAVKARDAERAAKTAELMRRRNDLEAQLIDRERRIAILRSERRAGSGRIALWLAAGALAGALLTLVATRVLGPETSGTHIAGTAADSAARGGAPSEPGEPPPAATGTSPAASARSPAAPSEPATAPTPEPSPAAAAAEAGPDLEAAAAAVRSWAAAWSEQRVDDYLAAYSEQFTPPDGLRRTEWASQRRNRILRPQSIQVTLGELRPTPLGADRVSVEFQQDYATESFADTVRKTLELVWEEGGWKIAAERTP